MLTPYACSYQSLEVCLRWGESDESMYLASYDLAYQRWLFGF